jgi:Icc-related predicted phosphoesterase
VIRIAALGDLHFGPDAGGTLRPRLQHLQDRADLFLIAGDLTRLGRPEEARALATELEGLPVATVAVLGNHDHHDDRADEIAAILADVGVTVLEGEGRIFELDGFRVGVAGTKGFGGGFAGACATDFGEAEMKAFVRHTADLASRLEAVLTDLEADVQVALLHYAPVAGTLQGEPPEIHAFLGSYLLGEAIDRAGADLVVHGHAHRGVERGETPGGIPVRNVALPVIQRSYALYEAEPRAASERGRRITA